MSHLHCSYPWQRSLQIRSSSTERVASPWQLCPCSLTERLRFVLILHHGLVSIDLSFDQECQSNRFDLARLRLVALRLN